MLSDIFPTGFPRCRYRGREARLDGVCRRRGAGRPGGGGRRAAARRFRGDRRRSQRGRLAQARSFGCETVDVSKGSPQDQLEQTPGRTRGRCRCRRRRISRPTDTARVRQGGSRHRAELADGGDHGGRRDRDPRALRHGDPGGIDEAAKVGSLSLSLGTGWAKSISFTTGQCPVMRYNLGLMKAILSRQGADRQSRERDGDLAG